MQQDLISAIERAKTILITPRPALEHLVAEPKNIQRELIRYVLIIAAIPPVAKVVGGLAVFSLVGSSLLFIRLVVFGAVIYGLNVAAVFITAKIINMLATSFGTEKDESNAFKLSVCVYTPVFIAGVLNILPVLGGLALLGMFYGCYILWLGLPILMRTPENQVAGYTVAAILSAFFIISVITGLVQGMFWTGAATPFLGSQRFF